MKRGINKRRYRLPATSKDVKKKAKPLEPGSSDGGTKTVRNMAIDDRQRLLQKPPWMTMPSISSTRGIFSANLVTMAGSLRAVYAPFYVHNCTSHHITSVVHLNSSSSNSSSLALSSLLSADSSDNRTPPTKKTPARSTFMLPTFVPCKAPSDSWEDLDVDLRLPLPVPRAEIFGNRDEIDEIFSTTLLRGIHRRSLAVILISGPTGSGKTLASISSCFLHNRRCVVVDGTEFSLNPARICKLLQRHMFPCRQRIVVFRGMQCLTDGQAEVVVTFFERNVFAMPRRHNLCFMLADTSGCRLFRALAKNELFGESRLCRRIYLHRATDEDMAQALRAWKWDEVAEEGISAHSLGARANGDFRALRGMVDRGGKWFRSAKAAYTDQSSDPFVLVPSMWGGIPNEVKPVDLRDTDRRRALTESVAEVIHDVAGVFQENYTRVIPTGGDGSSVVEQMYELADMLSTVDLLSAWREGDGEAGDDDFMAGQFGSEVMVSCCVAMSGSLKSISPGCSAWAYPSHAVMVEENTVTMVEQRSEIRLLLSPHEEEEEKESTSLLEFVNDLDSDNVLGRSKGMRAINAEQMLDWPVVLRRM